MMGFFKWFSRRQQQRGFGLNNESLEKLEENVEKELFPPEPKPSVKVEEPVKVDNKQVKMEYLMNNLGWSGKIVEKVK